MISWLTNGITCYLQNRVISIKNKDKHTSECLMMKLNLFSLTTYSQMGFTIALLCTRVNLFIVLSTTMSWIGHTLKRVKFLTTSTCCNCKETLTCVITDNTEILLFVHCSWSKTKSWRISRFGWVKMEVGSQNLWIRFHLNMSGS